MKLLMVFLFLLGFNPLFANPLNNNTDDFNVKSANQQFDHINLQLSVQNLNLQNLNKAIETLSTLMTKADQCVEDNQKKISNIDILIKQGSNVSDGAKDGADLVYLNNQHKMLADEQSQCRLFSIRAKEAIDAYRTAITQLKQEQVLTRGLPLWKIGKQVIETPFDSESLAKPFEQFQSILPSLLGWLLIFSGAILGTILILHELKNSLFARHYLRYKRIRLTNVFLVASTILAGELFIFFLATAPDLPGIDFPVVLMGIIFFYLSALLSLFLLFKIINIKAIFYWYSLEYSYFRKLSVALITVYTIALTARLLTSFYNTTTPFWQLCQNLFILLLLSMGAYFVYLFCKMHRHFPFINNHYRFILRASLLLFCCCAILDLLGYHTLASQLTYSGFLTFLIIFITVLITQGINKLYLLINDQPRTKAKTRKYFGYRQDQIFTEILILKTIAQIIIIFISLYLIAQCFGFATDYVETFYEKLLYGLHFANMTLYPTRIIAGTVIFCLLYLLSRMISASISRHQQFEDEEETQVAVASILNYLGFTVAIIAGFFVAGFNFTGLAIIAGALSVGIGLGLQSIVNNFVSGLILLIEKPIRPGDRISVEGIEGFVKKIRVRSTQLTTTAREDIIIPNSNLITRPVINYMFSDRYYRLNCDIGVAYGSDTNKVREVLLEVANAHEDTIKVGRNKPQVLFLAFNDNAMIFQLTCIIRDVNRKSLVLSELNYAIEAAFRKNQIEMPFPQRELHIKLDELRPALTPDEQR